MGSCISKCRPNKTHNSEDHQGGEENFNHVQDKLVIISQPPPTTKLQNITPLYNIPNKISPSPSPPSPSASTSSSSSVTSFTTFPYSTKTTTSSSSSSSTSSSSSSSSSVSFAKDVKSFSNDFLWSCYKENPHIVRINSIKQQSSNSNITTPFSSFPPKVLHHHHHHHHRHHSPQQVPVSSNVASQKRVRSSSPSSATEHLARQKSFRRDVQPTEKSNSRPSRRLDSRSPSPSRSRRFVSNGDNYKCTHSKRTAPSYSLGSSRRLISALGNYSDSTTSYYSRRDHNRPSLSPKDISSGDRPIRSCLRNRDQPYLNNIINRIGSKIDEIAVGDAMVTDHEIDSVSMEDFNNPLISLDCFIFL